MFGVDFNTVVVWLVPKVLRTGFNVNWLKALVSPIVTVYNRFTTYRTNNLYKLGHNGQVCYLEGALNDSFDPSLRRIFISDAGGDVISLIHRDSDVNALVLHDDSPGTFIMHNDSAYFGGSYDFIVNIPYLFSQADLYRLHALVNYYKLAGKRYDVIVNTK